VVESESVVELGGDIKLTEVRPSWSLNAVFERFLSLLLLVMASPLFLILPLLIKWQDGGPAFYRGERMGKDKEPFYMYKFRTLIEGAESQVGGALLNHGHQLQTPLGRFLRDSRIDELPQLFNVLCGDMSFFGPRPERKAVYEEQCKHIPGYDKRFQVKPGVMGYSQVFTPHSTPKRLRSSIDNGYARSDQSASGQVALAVFTIFYLALGVVKRLGRLCVERCLLLIRMGRVSERRDGDRIRPKGVKLTLTEVGGGADLGLACLVDVNEGHMQVRAAHPLGDQPFIVRLTIDSAGGWFNEGKYKTASCTAEVAHDRVQGDGAVDGLSYSYVLRYQPSSDLNRYLFDKYLIGKSVL